MTDVPTTPVKNSFMFNSKKQINEDSALQKRNTTFNFQNHRREMSQNITPIGNKQPSIMFQKTPIKQSIRVKNSLLNNSALIPG